MWRGRGRLVGTVLLHQESSRMQLRATMATAYMSTTVVAPRSATKCPAVTRPRSSLRGSPRTSPSHDVELAFLPCISLATKQKKTPKSETIVSWSLGIKDERLVGTVQRLFPRQLAVRAEYTRLRLRDVCWSFHRAKCPLAKASTCHALLFLFSMIHCSSY